MIDLTPSEVENHLLASGFNPQRYDFCDPDVKGLKWDRYGIDVFYTSDKYPAEYIVNMITLKTRGRKLAEIISDRSEANKEIYCESQLLQYIKEFEELYSQYKKLITENGFNQR